jgi:hypothetical protein
MFVTSHITTVEINYFCNLIVVVPDVPNSQALSITNVTKFGMCQFVVANVIIIIVVHFG